MARFAAILLVCALVWASHPAGAGEADIELGGHLAERQCAQCHGGTAPPLAAYARQAATDDEFEDRILFGHADLPQFQFTANELTDLVAYIAALSR